MKFLPLALAVLLAATGVSSSSIDEDINAQRNARFEEEGEEGEVDQEHRDLLFGSRFSCRGDSKLALKLINLTRLQPFAPNFFVAVHNGLAPPLFEYNAPASDALRALAENGDASQLVQAYQGLDSVVFAGTTDRPLFPGPPVAGSPPASPLFIDIDMVSKWYPFVTIASMFVNSNDGFVALNGEFVYRGAVFYLNGIDAGTEENNQRCTSIPGPTCPGTGNAEATTPPLNPEGFVHIHTGFHDLGTREDGVLPPQAYDWRNPMVRVEVVCADPFELATST